MAEEEEEAEEVEVEEEEGGSWWLKLKRIGGGRIRRWRFGVGGGRRG